MCDFVLLAQAEELSVKLDPYIRTQRRDLAGEPTETQIWPLIKHVEVTLPRSELIPEGVVLVDIPGTGDFNSKRDEMWKKVILFHVTLFPLPSTPPPFLKQQRIFCSGYKVETLRPRAELQGTRRLLRCLVVKNRDLLNQSRARRG